MGQGLGPPCPTELAQTKSFDFVPILSQKSYRVLIINQFEPIRAMYQQSSNHNNHHSIYIFDVNFVVLSLYLQLIRYQRQPNFGGPSYRYKRGGPPIRTLFENNYYSSVLVHRYRYLYRYYCIGTDIDAMILNIDELVPEGGLISMDWYLFGTDTDGIGIH